MRLLQLLFMMIALVTAVATAHAEGHTRSAHHTDAHVETPLDALVDANAAARQRPTRAGFREARHIYIYQPGAIYELYANPNYVSTILLEPGETISSIAAGDTSRWMVTEAESETDTDGRSIVLVKPQSSNLRTNIVIITDRRTYLVEVISQAGSAYMAQAAWSYPQTENTIATNPLFAELNFDYRVWTTRGARPVWSPVRVFDDARRTWVEFASNVAGSDLPPLFVITADGAELVNYRVQNSTSGPRYMIDRIFDVAELRLGARAQTIVRIERNRRPPVGRSIGQGPRS
jgi:type IV secretion system protein VirB9